GARLQRVTCCQLICASNTGATKRLHTAMAPLAGATAARQLEEELPSKISVRYPLWAIVGLVFALIAGASISTPALAQSAASNQKAAVQAQQALEQAGTASTQAGTASTLAGDLLQQQLAAP